MSGIVELDSGSTGHSGRYAIASASSGGESEPVAAASMDGFAALTEIIGDRPTTVKIDVEGFELSPLSGLTTILPRPANHAWKSVSVGTGASGSENLGGWG